MAFIELEGVEKTFTVRRKRGRFTRTKDEVRAVEGLTFGVERGEMVGYIGPNGAGKSTTVKMLTGILTPSAGRLRVAGVDPQKERVRLAQRIGVVFGQRTTLWWDLPLRDSFTLVRRIYRIPQDRFEENLGRCVDQLELGPLLDTPVRQLSLGQRMRGDITAALLHDPEVLYLDEPTIGLDILSKATVRRFLAEVNARGTTVLLTTHDLQDIEQLCRRVMVIDHGRVVYDGGLEGLQGSDGAERTLVVDLAGPSPAIDVDGARVVRREGDGERQWLAFPAGRSAAPLVAAVAERYPLVDLSVREPDIEDVIARLYRGVPAQAT
ncbi:methionine ABC transporter ATP-binding protein [Mangrovactinospora gilvigrisea]|uniref:Methionine ABC transporter ATP-binding protein n=1 Tax=Mangrovactinospora gilvigrisea TaxID=1428644 RepID=A0A1J7C524_9ACTN|nr:ATP-binding cassette domain-containing protein [Mangrovactinospora gilvigrisea]OIV36656.1 methionine ABC transporter ATP-binding protein [Mangrovactinospora gilvigrisea]